MTKRGYIAIAHVLNVNHASLEIVQDMADMLGEDNPRFDRTRFMDAACIEIAMDAQTALRRIINEVSP